MVVSDLDEITGRFHLIEYMGGRQHHVMWCDDPYEAMRKVDEMNGVYEDMVENAPASQLTPEQWVTRSKNNLHNIITKVNGVKYS